MRIVSNGVQPYIVQTGVDTDGETQEEVTTFRMQLDVSEWVNGAQRQRCCAQHALGTDRSLRGGLLRFQSNGSTELLLREAVIARLFEFPPSVAVTV
ncbi:hypothetical protein DPX16_8453 [Anabarilius grahami]|uniref:Uncharacterized protein n=1 Tax=Anabarilius grahami TaxID=495550 RepID=A0A3N0Z322_ANAGA|nr:hypothetical protein DPX16_8453 [Anabarilius grahami]